MRLVSVNGAPVHEKASGEELLDRAATSSLPSALLAFVKAPPRRLTWLTPEPSSSGNGTTTSIFNSPGRCYVRRACMRRTGCKIHLDYLRFAFRKRISGGKQASGITTVGSEVSLVKVIGPAASSGACTTDLA